MYETQGVDSHDEYKLLRRKVLKAFSGVASGVVAVLISVVSEERRSPNDRPRVGVSAMEALLVPRRGLKRLADIVAIADVDKQHLEQYNAERCWKSSQFSDYRDLIDKPGIDAIFVVHQTTGT